MTVGVVKIGGAMGNDHLPILRELAVRVGAGEKWLLVHGGSGEMERVCSLVGIESVYVSSPSGFRSRFTGVREMAIFSGACSSVSMEIVSSLWEMNCPALPFWPGASSGARARRKDVLRSVEGHRTVLLRGNMSGAVTSFAPNGLDRIWAQGWLPVMAPLAWDEADGGLLNVDGDRLAALTAASLMSDVLVILTNVPGVMSDPQDPSSLVASGSVEDLMEMARGNMKRKIVAAEEALIGGVKRVILGDSRVENPLSMALYGRGTSVCLGCTRVEG